MNEQTSAMEIKKHVDAIIALIPATANMTDSSKKAIAANLINAVGFSVLPATNSAIAAIHSTALETIIEHSLSDKQALVYMMSVYSSVQLVKKGQQLERNIHSNN